MLMSWPHIEHNMKTRKDCYHLIEKLGEQRVSSYERLEKYFSNAYVVQPRVGRPKQPYWCQRKTTCCFPDTQ